MSAPLPVLELQDLDLMVREFSAPGCAARLRRLGFGAPETVPLERLRARVAGALDRRWLAHYERAQQRYGRGVVAVRGRVCSGCFVTLPTSASPAAGETLTVCESCGRILYWG